MTIKVKIMAADTLLVVMNRPMVIRVIQRRIFQREPVLFRYILIIEVVCVVCDVRYVPVLPNSEP